MHYWTISIAMPLRLYIHGRFLWQMWLQIVMKRVAQLSVCVCVCVYLCVSVCVCVRVCVC